MNGKTKAWRNVADRLLETLARDNKYIVADMVIIFLEAASYGLQDYSPLGGVFKRAAKRGIISRVDRPTKQALWVSKVYDRRKMRIGFEVGMGKKVLVKSSNRAYKIFVKHREHTHD